MEKCCAIAIIGKNNMGIISARNERIDKVHQLNNFLKQKLSPEDYEQSKKYIEQFEKSIRNFCEENTKIEISQLLKSVNRFI